MLDMGLIRVGMQEATRSNNTRRPALLPAFADHSPVTGFHQRR
jgi:hypothetical protein